MSAKSCIIKFNDSSLSKELTKRTGHNNIKFAAYEAAVIENGQFNQAFTDWYKARYKRTPNLEVKDAKNLADRIIEYYNTEVYTTARDITNQSVDAKQVLENGYNSFQDRELGKHFVAVSILRTYRDVHDLGINIRGSKRDYYTNAAKRAWNDYIFESIAARRKKDINQVKEEYDSAEDKYAYINKELGKNKTVSEVNLIAVWNELNGSVDKAQRFIDEVFATNEISNIRAEIDDVETDKNINDASDANREENDLDNGEDVAKEEDATDDTISKFDHSGVYSTWLKHLNQRLVVYFNTLEVLNSPTQNDGTWDINRNNSFGIANTMDAAACSKLIFANNGFANTDEMIYTIRRLSTTIPGFESFAKFADDLEHDADLRTEVFTTFSKAVVPKLETVIENKEVNTRISNLRANPRLATMFLAYDDMRASIGIDNTFMQSRVNAFERSLKKKSGIVENAKERLNKDVDDIIDIVRQYLPSIPANAIKTFVQKNNYADNDVNAQYDNLNIIVGNLKTIIKSASATQTRYNSFITRINEAVEHNNAIKHDVSGQPHSHTEYINIAELYKEDYLDASVNTAVAAIVDNVLQYINPDVSFNSRNQDGNQNSDVINNSLVTYMRRLNSRWYMYRDETTGNATWQNDELLDWGRERLLSQQYTYSNILLEHRDEEGNILNKGLFRKGDNGELSLTEYAKDLFDIYYYNGASDLDNGTSAGYSKMNIGVYAPTTYMNYFKANVNGVSDSNFANYFLRIPSDAPKTFILRAPRYSTKNLYSVANRDEIRQAASEIVDNYDRISIADFTRDYFNEETIKVKGNNINSTEDIIANYLTDKGDMYVPTLKAVKEIPDSNEVYVAVETIGTYKNPDGTYSNHLYIIKGTLVKRGKANFLTNREYVASVSDTHDMDENVKNIIRNYYERKLETHDVTVKGTTYNKAKREINRNHPIVKILLNNFKQELLDMATTLDHYFEFNADGSIKFEAKTYRPVFKPGVKDTDGYRFYDLGKNGSVIEASKTGNISHYRLGGNVFKSNKFTVKELGDDNVLRKVNYMQDMFDDSINSTGSDGRINLLYGGRESKLNIVRSDTGLVTDVQLTEAQQERAINNIVNFLNSYFTQAQEEVANFSNFVKGVPTTIDAVVDFAANQLITHYAYDDIFEGGVKFYADAQTVLKRAKEVQGSGVSYGIVDFNDSNIGGLYDIPNAYLNNGKYSDYAKEQYIGEDGKRHTKEVPRTRTIQEVFAGTELAGITQRNGWRAVTIENSKNTNHAALQELIGVLTRPISKKGAGMSKEAATNLLYGSLVTDKNGNPIYDKNGLEKHKGGYQDTKVNDAQSYITFKEWVRRIAARGQLKRYMPLIEKLLDPNAVLTDNDLNEFVQVQKNFYYDLHYDSDFNRFVPRQIKNAEFVLVPRFIKGTQLERVAQMMEEADIDQLNTVETSKASNRHVLTLWDNDGEISEERYQNFAKEAKGVAEIYYYKYLYTQQETPQHVNTTNKAGIQIVKKMIDNLAQDDPNKLNFFANYVANIEESWRNLLDELDVPRDENGNILTDQDGQILGINKKVLYERFKEELYRTGINSNILDFVTLDETTNQPIAPAISNLVLDKIETTHQAIYNSKITRQKLPGFHAAQVTNIGWKRLDNGESKYCLKTNANVVISKEEFNSLDETEKKKYRNTQVQYDGSLRYHPNGEGYIEVKLTYSALGINKNDPHYKGMTNAEIIKELEEQGLDKIIGYRIPTEGKQSVAVMKVVDFIDDGLGSTIVVPNDWVSQTGSDFDIDSVYGITFDTHRGKGGKLIKAKFVDGDNYTVSDWINYIKNYADRNAKGYVRPKIKQIIDAINSSEQEEFVSLRAQEDEAFKKFISVIPEQSKGKMVNRFKNEAKRIRTALDGASNREIWSAQLEKYIQIASDLKAKLKNANTIAAIDEFISSCDDILNFLNDQDERFERKKDAALTEEEQKRIDKYNEIAKEAGLLTFDEYFDALDVAKTPTDFAKLNTRHARNNAIVQSMLNILQDVKNLEENLSRSNSDDIEASIDKCLGDNAKAERENRSQYNVFDEMRYQEEAMSGAVLKGASVFMDSVCSICNVVKPTLRGGVKVSYDAKSYNQKEITKRYGLNDNDISKGRIRVIHNQYGWSSDNRNVVGRLITPYSSETTAYILDAIKKGAMPNVNQFTFPVLKHLVNLGIDYDTAVSFMANPAISTIIRNNNRFNSIYSNEFGNAIHESINEIARQLGIKVDEKTPIVSVLASVQSKFGDIINKIFKVDKEDVKFSLEEESAATLALMPDKLIARLKDNGVFGNTTPVEEKLIFDLGNILIFNRLRNQAQEVGRVATALNPDKFGAKMSLFATNQIFDKILEQIYTDSSYAEERENPILSVNGEHILKSIYPGITGDPENGIAPGVPAMLRADISKSTYPSLAAFLKYATATSSVIAKQVLLTQHPAFIRFCNGLATKFSDVVQEMDEKQYNDFQKYAISYFYNNVESIRRPIVPVKNEDGTYSYNIDNSDTPDDATISIEDAERERVFGYNRVPALSIVEKVQVTRNGKTINKTVTRPIEIENLNHPTQEELNDFAQLSPAQKVKFIKTHFDDAGVFDYIDVQLYNPAIRGWRTGMQTLEYLESNVGDNVIFNMFYEAYNNRNPLVAMTARDVIKYAVQVEGYRMRQTAAGKTISNKPLNTGYEEGGMNFFAEVAEMFSTIGTTGSAIFEQSSMDEIYERYLRSHIDNPHIKSFRLTNSSMVKFNIHTRSYDMLVMEKKYDENSDDDKIAKKFNNNCAKVGIKTYHPTSNTYTTNNYLRVYRDGKVLLYKIKDFGDKVILYPLNKLQPNETTEWSANDNNNEHPNKMTYEGIINDYQKQLLNDGALQFTSGWIKESNDARKQNGEKPVVYYNHRRDYSNQAATVEFNLDKLANEEGGALAQAREQIRSNFARLNAKQLYIRNAALGNYIFVPGIENASKQTITMKDGAKSTFLIAKVDTDRSKINKRYLSNDKETNAKAIENIDNDSLRQAYKNANEIGLKQISDLFVVSPYITDSGEDIAMASNIEENFYGMIDNIARVAHTTGEQEAVYVFDKFTKAGVNSTKQAIRNNIELAVRESARYYSHKAQELKNQVNFFIEDPTLPGQYISMNSDEVYNRLVQDEDMTKRYLRVSNEITALRNLLAPFEELNLDSEDSQLQGYIDALKKAYKTVRELPVNEINTNYARKVLARTSTNPVITANIIDVLDNYHRNYGAMWKFHDIAESGNPFVQLLMRDIASLTEAKRMQTQRFKQNYQKRIKEIQDEAARNGYTIDLNKMIDKHGYFVKGYTHQFIEDYDRLRVAKNNAAAEHGIGSIEWLKARNEYEDFKAKHINQEVKQEYYEKRNANEKYMLDNYPEIYEEYMKLHYQRIELMSYSSDHGTTQDIIDKIADVERQMFNLTRPNYYINADGQLVERPVRDTDIQYSPENERVLRLYSRDAQTTLNNYLDAQRKLNEEYYEYDSAFGFEENLEKYLNIIKDFEQRDANGIPTVPITVLENNPKYVEARSWIRENAQFVISPTDEAIKSEDSIAYKLTNALNRLLMGRNGKSYTVNDIMNNANEGKGIRDERGVPDGTRLTDKERASIKKNQEDAYQINENTAGSDRILINSISKRGGDTYKGEFYRSMSSDKKIDNARYLKLVTELNGKLEKYYSDIDGIIHFEQIPDTDEGIEELNEIAMLYQQIRAVKKQYKSSTSTESTEFIKDNVDFVYDKDIYLSQASAVNDRSSEYTEAWMRVNLERNENGDFIQRQDGTVVPNNMIYSYAKPKGKPGEAKYDKWVDNQKAEDLAIVNQYYRKVKTRYYYQAMREAMRQEEENHDGSYQKWYQDNHIYNPYTRKYEPLACWLMNEYRDELFKDNEFEGQWMPKRKQRERVVRDGNTSIIVNGVENTIYNEYNDKRNTNYNPNLPLSDNYIQGSGYDNTVTLNPYEVQMRDYMQSVLQSLAHVDSAKKYFSRGALPRQLKPERATIKKNLKEISKIVGFNVSTNNGKQEYYEELSYETDKTPLMPLTNTLMSKDRFKAKTIDEAEQQLEGERSIDMRDVIRPQRDQFETVEEYNQAVNRFDTVSDQVKAHNREIQENLMDRDWYDVIENFIEQAGHYNAVQDIKEQLYYGLSMLENQQAFIRKYGAFGNLKRDDRRTTDNNQPVYETTVDKDIISQWKTYMRRVLYDQWKEPESRLTAFANNLQGFTSANYMMLNIRGGIANVTLGETGILAEAAAHEYFHASEWAAGTTEWSLGVLGFVRGMYSEKAYNKQDAIAKFFKAVDYDEHTGVSRLVDMATWSERLRNLGFSPQTIGEHFMQNSVLFATMKSHKVVPMPNDPKGIGFTIMNKEEYIRYRQSDILNDLLNEEQRKEFVQFMKDISMDADLAKDYAWFRKEPFSQFLITHCSNEQRKEFGKRIKEQRKKLSEEFDNYNSLYEQVELGEDGYMKFVEGSDLAQLDEKPYNDITQAIDLMGRFSERVRSINKKIHGVYNRLGSADIERKWYGSLIMQYHKHLPMGILKRYRIRGYYNETRGSVEKGMVSSVVDFLSLNFDAVKHDAGLSDDEVFTLKGLQNLFTSIGDFLIKIPTTWAIMPEYDRANIRRNLGDAVGVLASLSTSVALFAIGDDDDDGILYNLAIYEADRLGSEAFMYNPIGAINEGKKLMSTPIAAQSIINDAWKTMNEICGFILEGDEYDPYYKNGRFAGESKLSVFIQRRIPIWNGIRNIVDISENNKFYKVGTTGSILFNTQAMGNWVAGEGYQDNE